MHTVFLLLGVSGQRRLSAIQTITDDVFVYVLSAKHNAIWSQTKVLSLTVIVYIWIDYNRLVYFPRTPVFSYTEISHTYRINGYLDLHGIILIHEPKIRNVNVSGWNERVSRFELRSASLAHPAVVCRASSRSANIEARRQRCWLFKQWRTLISCRSDTAPAAQLPSHRK